MRKLAWSVALGMGIITLYLGTKFLVLGNTISLDSGEVEISISEPNKVHIMDEMRDYLSAVQHVNQSLINDEILYLEKAFLLSKDESFLKEPQGLMKNIPIEYRYKEHKNDKIFTQIAGSHHGNIDRNSLEKQFDNLLNNCVDCHKKFEFGNNDIESGSKHPLFAEHLNNNNE